jgi:predicted RNA-binding Zn-ribbon protein involved in translation (DUF1610 family)
MPITFQCPQCRKKLKAPDKAVGKSSKCPGCGRTVICPEPVFDAEVVEMTMIPEKPPGLNPYDDLDDDKPYAMVNPPAAQESAIESRRPCPLCGEMILMSAVKCRFCGEVFDPTLKRAKKGGFKTSGLRDIAALQKYPMICALGLIVSFPCYWAASLMARAARSGPTPIPLPISGFVVLLLLLFAIANLGAWVLSVLLASKVYGTGGAIIVFFLQLIPCINLVTLLVVSNKATTILRDRGHAVGLMGADLSEF